MVPTASRCGMPLWLIFLCLSCTKADSLDLDLVMTPRKLPLSPDLTRPLVVYGIRHGKSVGNEFMSQQGNAWGDPTFRDDISFRDTPLSEVGRKQAEDLARKLKSSTTDWLQQVELVVVSPLTRCLQTYQYGVKPALDTLDKCPRVLALPLATERVFTAGETGRPVQELKPNFPSLDWSEMERHIEQKGSDTWWYSQEDNAGDLPEWRPHGEGQYYAVPGEPKDAFRERMQKLEAWLALRPERCILMVAHWGVLRHFTGQECDNCGVVKIEWHGEQEDQ